VDVSLGVAGCDLQRSGPFFLYVHNLKKVSRKNLSRKKSEPRISWMSHLLSVIGICRDLYRQYD
jgi:hypothetical protein